MRPTTLIVSNLHSQLNSDNFPGTGKHWPRDIKNAYSSSTRVYATGSAGGRCHRSHSSGDGKAGEGKAKNASDIDAQRLWTSAQAYASLLQQARAKVADEAVYQFLTE